MGNHKVQWKWDMSGPPLPRGVEKCMAKVGGWLEDYPVSESPAVSQRDRVEAAKYSCMEANRRVNQRKSLETGKYKTVKWTYEDYEYAYDQMPKNIHKAMDRRLRINGDWNELGHLIRGACQMVLDFAGGDFGTFEQSLLDSYLDPLLHYLREDPQIMPARIESYPNGERAWA